MPQLSRDEEEQLEIYWHICEFVKKKMLAFFGAVFLLRSFGVFL